MQNQEAVKESQAARINDTADHRHDCASMTEHDLRDMIYQTRPALSATLRTQELITALFTDTTTPDTATSALT